MPDILTHLVCADEALKSINKDIEQVIQANRKIYNLGAQGPDLFFYYKVYPWQKSGDFHEIGTLIHTTSPNAFFLNAANIIRNMILSSPLELFKTEDKKSDTHKLFAYLAGFLSHYALDTHAHPFIYYFSGANGGYNHKYFECILDTIISDIYDAKKIRLHKTGRAININSYDRYIVADFISMIISQTYNKDVKQENIQQAIKDMKRVMYMMYDPSKFKSGSIKIVDRLSKMNGKITTALYPARYDSKVDHLNLIHSKWCHPCDQNDVKTDSFLDLLNQGKIKSSKLILQLAHYITQQTNETTFTDSIGNKLYDTGLEASQPQEMFYDHLIVSYKDVFKLK